MEAEGSVSMLLGSFPFQIAHIRNHVKILEGVWYRLFTCRGVGALRKCCSPSYVSAGSNAGSQAVGNNEKHYSGAKKSMHPEEKRRSESKARISRFGPERGRNWHCKKEFK